MRCVVLSSGLGIFVVIVTVVLGIVVFAIVAVTIADLLVIIVGA